MYEVTKSRKTSWKQRFIPRDRAIFQSVGDAPATVGLDIEVPKILETQVDYSLRIGHDDALVGRARIMVV